MRLPRLATSVTLNRSSVFSCAALSDVYLGVDHEHIFFAVTRGSAGSRDTIPCNVDLLIIVLDVLAYLGSRSFFYPSRVLERSYR